MAFRRSFGRAIGVLIFALTPWILLSIGVHAQAPPNLPPPYVGASCIAPSARKDLLENFDELRDRELFTEEYVLAES